MSLTLGELTFYPALDNLDLLAKPVQKILKEWTGETPAKEILAVELDPEFSGSAEFCEKYKIAPNLGANCLIVKSKRAGVIKYAACLVPVDKRADINGMVRKYLNASDASFAPKEFAVSESQMEYGSITVVGLPAEWPILIDKSLIEMPYLVIGGGLRKSKLLIPGKALAELPNAVILEGLGK